MGGGGGENIHNNEEAKVGTESTWLYFYSSNCLEIKMIL